MFYNTIAKHYFLSLNVLIKIINKSTQFLSTGKAFVRYCRDFNRTAGLNKK